MADNGPGIPEKDLPRIFDPYFSTKTTGSGIGLTVSYSIIRKHDGYLTVSSKSGEGSVFSFFLPATQKSLPPSLTAPPCGVTSRGRVLLMDDDPLILRTGERLLTSLGYDVTCASDGKESAVLFKEAFFKGFGFRLVILDLTVPGGTGGQEVISRLRKIDPAVKAVVSSGYSTDPVMANHRQYGFDGVLQKPYTLEEMKAVLQNIEMHE